jgi:arylsulfatase A-like enzyme
VLPEGAVVEEVVTALDFLPTFAGLAGAKLPARPIDGRDAWPVLAAGAPSTYGPFYYYARGRLEAVRSGRHKLMFANPLRPEPVPEALYDLTADPGETTDVSADHPDILAQLRRLGDDMRARLGDAIQGMRGPEEREIGVWDEERQQLVPAAPAG